jgi:signal transduction histidine kinase
MEKILTPQQIRRLAAAQGELPETANAELDSPFLRLLSSLDRQQLNQLLAERRCLPGEIILREGQPGDALYVIWSGRVVAFMGDVESPTILGYRGAGEIVGEMALLEKQPRSATVVALTDLRLLAISQENFYNLLKSEPALGLSIMEVLSSRLRVSDQERSLGKYSERRLISRVSELQTEKQQLLELQRLRQETSDLIIHDLRNPLGSISLSINMLEMVLPEETLNENRQIIDVARHSCDRMIRLVDSLLEVSRMESGESQFHFAPLDLAELLHGVASSALGARERNIHMVIDVPEGLSAINADRDKLERVVTNLIDNAIKYTPDQGQITLAVEAQGNEIVVSVVDTGPGIPENQRQRIFERFAQVSGDKRARRGFGLGLAYCRLAVEAHGGRIWVEPGKNGLGSRFAFTLPLKQKN